MQQCDPKESYASPLPSHIKVKGAVAFQLVGYDPPV